MNLRDWLYEKKITITKFAKDLSVSRDHMNSIITGRHKTSARLAKDTIVEEAVIAPPIYDRKDF